MQSRYGHGGDTWDRTLSVLFQARSPFLRRSRRPRSRFCVQQQNTHIPNATKHADRWCKVNHLGQPDTTIRRFSSRTFCHFCLLFCNRSPLVGVSHLYAFHTLRRTVRHDESD